MDTKRDPMNFLFIGLDQIRFDTLGYNGNDICLTPNIDQLAKESFKFNRAYTTCPLCSPARASMFTGKYAFDHGMGTNCDMYHAMSSELNRPDELLHKKLIQNDYRCGYIGKWHVGTNIGAADYGFEGQNILGYGNLRFEKEFTDYLDENNLSYTLKDHVFYNPDNKTLQAAVWEGSEASTTEYYLTNRTIDLMEEYAEDDKPFFLTCQFWGPHGPHFPPTSFAGTTDRSQIKPWVNYEDDLEGKPNFVKRHLEGFYRNPPANWHEWQEVIGLYYDFTSFIDKQIGRILDRLEALGLKDNTMIFFTTDHGDMKGVHGGLIDKGFLYEEAMHIPLLMYHPHYKGREVDRFVYNMDIMPTVLDQANIDLPEIHGKSLMPIVHGEEWQRENAYLEFHGLRFLYSQRAVIDENNYKYIWTPGDFDELYDLNNDPGELCNQIDNEAYGELKEQLQSLLKKSSVASNDPVQDYIYKILGEWESPSGQIDITSQKI